MMRPIIWKPHTPLPCAPLFSAGVPPSNELRHDLPTTRHDADDGGDDDDDDDDDDDNDDNDD